MRGIGVYIIIVFAVICIWYWLSAGATSNSYTQSQFEKDLDKNQVKSVKVVQNREIPTGSLEVKFKDGTSKVLYVSDVNNIEKTMTKAGYTDYTVADVPSCPRARQHAPALRLLQMIYRPDHDIKNVIVVIQAIKYHGKMIVSEAQEL